jgi:hypothetical protein
MVPSRESFGQRPGTAPNTVAMTSSVPEAPKDARQNVQKMLERENILELVVAFASGSDRAGEELQRHGMNAVPYLLDALERRDADLRKRVHGLLEEMVNGQIPFDPFAPEVQRRQQLASLRESFMRMAG